MVLRFWFFSYKTCGILAAWPGIKHTPPVLEVKVLTTGPPGKPQEIISFRWGSPCGSDGKESACNVRDWGSILGLGRSPGVVATHSSILVWRIPWTEEPGGLQSMGSQRVRHYWATNTFQVLKMGHCEWDTHDGTCALIRRKQIDHTGAKRRGHMSTDQYGGHLPTR